MKLATSGCSIKGGNVDSVGYVVANSPEMMEILSNALYSDKIKAVIRELSTNAYDSHVAAGKKDIPFNVTLPTAKNPQFIIRDFGTGLSYDQLSTLYRTYGRSNKRNSNDQVGCFGLGSKSPFSYVDEFVTISYYNGEKITAINTKTAKGPVLNIAPPVPTDEPNGIEIIINVELSDIVQFERKAQSVYHWFVVHPKFIGKTIDLRPKKYISEDTGWGYSKCVPMAIMGQVAYSIESSQFDNADGDLLACGFDLYFNIGDIEFSPSRETLQYTDKTKQAISDRLAEIRTWFTNYFDDKIKSCKSLWEARCLIYSFESEYADIINTLKYKAQNTNFDVDWTVVTRNIPLSISMINGGIHKRKHFNVVATKNTVFYVADSTCSVEKCKHIKSTNKIFLVKHINTSLSKQVLTDYFGILPSEINYTSFLPAVKRGPRATVVKKANEISHYEWLKTKKSYGMYEKRNWTDLTSADLTSQSGYYILCDKGFSVYCKKSISNHQLRSFLECSNLSGNVNIIGIPNNKEHTIKNTTGFEHISEFVKERYSKISNTTEYKLWKYIHTFNIPNIHKSIVVLEPLSKEIFKVKGLSDTYSHLDSLAEEYNIKVSKNYIKPKIIKLYEKMPIIKTLVHVCNGLSYYQQDTAKEIAKHIEELIMSNAETKQIIATS